MAAIKQPSDKSHFLLPDLGEGVHEAELIKWRVKPGDTVKEHQILAEMNTDKALVEVPSPWAGTVSALGGKEGEILTVGSVLVRYATAGAAAPPAKPAAKPATPAAGANAVASVPPGRAAQAEDEDAGTVVGSVSG